jgi:hypothetical protein
VELNASQRANTFAEAGVGALHIWNLVEIVIVYLHVMDRPSPLAWSMNLRRGTKNRSHLQLLAISLSSSTNEYVERHCRRMIIANFYFYCG